MHTAYVSMTNIYASASMREDATMLNYVRVELSRQGANLKDFIHVKFERYTYILSIQI